MQSSLDRHKRPVEVANLVQVPLVWFEEEYDWKVISASSWCYLVLVVSWDPERWLRCLR